MPRPKYFEAFGESHTLREWETIKGIPANLIYQRIETLKWSLERALTEPHKPVTVDMMGEKWGMLKAIRSTNKRTNGGAVIWEFMCDCGKLTEKSTQCVRSGDTQSCGCMDHKRHNVIHDRSNTPEYQAWKNMIMRCRGSNISITKHYKLRGISVCARWSRFANFFEDMGLRPSPKHSLDRIDVNGNYEPSNCRWATGRVQALNKRKATLPQYLYLKSAAEKLIDALGEVLCDHQILSICDSLRILREACDQNIYPKKEAA